MSTSEIEKLKQQRDKLVEALKAAQKKLQELHQWDASDNIEQALSKAQDYPEDDIEQARRKVR